MLQVEFEEHRLENGLQVICHRDDRIPLLHVSLCYRVGSSFETPGLSGLAHLFEHLMFQGSERVAKNEHGRIIDGAGGGWNASTGKDRTHYFETVPSHFQDLVLWLEADRMRSLDLSEENFENQRRTVIEEKKQSYDNRPYGLSSLRFDELAYSNWAYAHPIIGSVQDLERATLDDARAFHRRHYGPGNAVLVVAGDLSPDILVRVKRHFGPIPDRTESRPPDLEEPAPSSEKRETVKDPLAALPALSMGYHMPELGSPQYYALSVLAMILTEGESSRLFRTLIQEQNRAIQVAAFPNQYRGPEIFRLWLQLQSGVVPAEVLEVVEGELEQLKQESVSRRELEKARNQIRFHFWSRVNRISRKGELLAYYASFFDDTARISSDLEHYLEVGADEILDAARQVFRNERRTVIAVEPDART